MNAADPRQLGPIARKPLAVIADFVAGVQSLAELSATWPASPPAEGELIGAQATLSGLHRLLADLRLAARARLDEAA